MYFQEEHPADKRIAECIRVRTKYPERIPVIIEKARGSDVADIDKKKFLVPGDMRMGQFMSVVRRRTQVGAEKAIFIFVHNIIPPTAAMMSELYEEHKDPIDGFLYFLFSGEATFG